MYQNQLPLYSIDTSEGYCLDKLEPMMLFKIPLALLNLVRRHDETYQGLTLLLRMQSDCHETHPHLIFPWALAWRYLLAANEL